MLPMCRRDAYVSYGIMRMILVRFLFSTHYCKYRIIIVMSYMIYLVLMAV